MRFFYGKNIGCCVEKGNKKAIPAVRGKGGRRKNKEERNMEEKEWVRCDRCDGEIYEGAEYYQINGECVCRECLEEFAGHWFAPFRLIAGKERL